MSTSEQHGPRGPLAGIRVLDLSSVIMGPLATQIMGDLGADVIVAEAAGGDTNRRMGAGPHPQLSGMSLNVLRNKRNVAIDLKTPSGRDALLRVAATCDVLVTNLRPGALGRLGLTYDDVVAVRPEVVYCQAAGFPSDGPDADRPAYDEVIQAAGAVSDLMEQGAGRPGMLPLLAADKVCGLTIAYAVMAALFDRERTGRGQFVEVPMVDAFRAFMLVEHGSAAISRPPVGPAGYRRILTPERGPQRTADGAIALFPYLDAHMEALLAIGGDDVPAELRDADREALRRTPGALYRLLDVVVPKRTTAEWMSLTAELGIPAAELPTLEELVEALPEDEHPSAGHYKVIPPPVRFSRTPASVRRPAPLIGEHNNEVLAEVGLTEGEVALLYEQGVLRFE
jgi:crotonobetainyl-CoA:carnitine CoA-transferase CaiB-like acyl-CoA transferase